MRIQGEAVVSRLVPCESREATRALMSTATSVMVSQRTGLSATQTSFVMHIVGVAFKRPLTPDSQPPAVQASQTHPPPA